LSNDFEDFSLKKIQSIFWFNKLKFKYIINIPNLILSGAKYNHNDDNNINAKTATLTSTQHKH